MRPANRKARGMRPTRCPVPLFPAKIIKGKEKEGKEMRIRPTRRKDYSRSLPPPRPPLSKKISRHSAEFSARANHAGIPPFFVAAPTSHNSRFWPEATLGCSLARTKRRSLLTAIRRDTRCEYIRRITCPSPEHKNTTQRIQRNCIALVLQKLLKP